MFKNPRKLVLWLGCVLFLIGGFLAWRAMHPPLSDQEQIDAQIEEIRTAVNHRSSGGAVKYLAKGFTYGGMSRSELKSNMGGLFLQWRHVELNVTGLHTQVQGDTAKSSGHFIFNTQSEEGSPVQSQRGDFTLHWEKRDGQWQIVQIDGGLNPGDVQP
ncbi:MAG: DUF4440 domain-containing protein [Abitibacteriaceae bacterium]|nr:DUF4440 domain-containing protein [Abditibacteriaceae bacterium]